MIRTCRTAGKAVGQTMIGMDTTMIAHLIKFYLERRRAKRTGIRALLRLVLLGGAA